MGDWFDRFRRYGWCVVGHLAQGAAAGLLCAFSSLAAAGLLWAAFYIVYQLASGARKWASTGHPDTMGLDAYDFLVGFLPVFIVARMFVLGWLP